MHETTAVDASEGVEHRDEPAAAVEAVWFALSTTNGGDFGLDFGVRIGATTGENLASRYGQPHARQRKLRVFHVEHPAF